MSKLISAAQINEDDNLLPHEDDNLMLAEEELTLDELSKHPILERITKRMELEVRSTSHVAHNSHYSSNT